MLLRNKRVLTFGGIVALSVSIIINALRTSPQPNIPDFVSQSVTAGNGKVRLDVPSGWSHTEIEPGTDRFAADEVGIWLLVTTKNTENDHPGTKADVDLLADKYRASSKEVSVKKFAEDRYLVRCWEEVFFHGEKKTEERWLVLQTSSRGLKSCLFVYSVPSDNYDLKARKVVAFFNESVPKLEFK